MTCFTIFRLMLALAVQVLPGSDPQGSDPDPNVAVETAPATADQGVSLWVDLQEDGPRRCGTFDAFDKIVLDLRLRSIGDGTKRIVVDGGEGRFRATPLLFEIELARVDGRPLLRPTWQLGTQFTPNDGGSDLLQFAHVQELGPEEVAMWRVSLSEWSGWGSLDLEPGDYRIRVTYHGAPAPAAADQWADAHVRRLTAGNWRGTARSQELRFRIRRRDGTPDWSDPQDGLRIAAMVRPDGRRVLGDQIRPRYLVENVSEQALSFVRAVGSSQEDELEVVHPTFGPRPESRGFCTGWYPVVSWTLPPHARVWIDAAPIVTTTDRFPTPGKYVLRSTLSLRDGLARDAAGQAEEKATLAAAGARKWSSELASKPFELELVASR